MHSSGKYVRYYLAGFNKLLWAIKKCGGDNFYSIPHTKKWMGDMSPRPPPIDAHEYVGIGPIFRLPGSAPLFSWYIVLNRPIYYRTKVC